MPKRKAGSTPECYTVNRVQDEAEVRRALKLNEATDEAASLNAQARVLTGQTVHGFPIYASMLHGEVCRYEVRSMSGLVVA
jgi:hypothetical protein